MLYHLTRPYYIDSIRQKGIIPCYRRGMTWYPRCAESKLVWVTDNYQWIRENQYGLDEEVAIFKIFRPIDEFAQRIDYPCGDDFYICQHEFITNEPIRPDELILYKVIDFSNL